MEHSPPPACAESQAQIAKYAAAHSQYPPNAVHLVRTSQQMTMHLSQMADQKASILMGATFVVFTLAIGQARMGDGMLAMPLAMLATFSFLSALFAIAAVLPRISARHAEAETDGNILFFGQFTQWDEQQFINKVKEKLAREDDIYEMMLRDTYQNGVVLARRKYRYLAYAYHLFMAGLILTFLIFLLQMAGHCLSG